MKIYTKTGDGGETGLYGGKRVPKSDLRVIAYGDVDELNSLLGVCISELKDQSLQQALRRVQHELFIIGADISTPFDVNTKLHILRISDTPVQRLEEEIDSWTSKLDKLTHFILPGGSKAAAMIQYARAVSRRAERSVVNACKTNRINKEIIVYLNRLSDWLFTLARFLNKQANVREEIWKTDD